MLKHLLALTCMNKKDKKKLAFSLPEQTSTSDQKFPATSSGDTIDELLTEREDAHLNAEQFMSNVLSDVSFDVASCQNRATPIDFGTREVKEDSDVFSVTSRPQSVNLITPFSIPEETEGNFTDKLFSSPFDQHNTSRSGQLRKSARFYYSNNSNESSASPSSSSNNSDSLRVDNISVHASKSAHNRFLKGRLMPVLGGSLGPLPTKRQAVAFNGNSSFADLHGRRSGNDRSNSHDRCGFSFYLHAAFFRHAVCSISKT